MTEDTPRGPPGSRDQGTKSQDPGKRPRGGRARSSDQRTASGDHRTERRAQPEPEILPPEAKRGSRSPIRIEFDREALAALDKRALLGQLAIGIAAGWIASVLVGGSGFLRYAITGLIGSLLGGFVLEKLGLDLGIRNPVLERLAVATLGAVAVVLLTRLIA